MDEKIKLSNIGEITNEFWLQIPEKFPFITLGEWVIMPNHLHGILAFFCDSINRNILKTGGTINQRRDKSRLYDAGGITAHHNPMLTQNLSNVIRWFKGKTTFEIRKYCSLFAWQSRFYEHVIRNDIDYNVIAEYIMFNPLNWKQDENFTKD